MDDLGEKLFESKNAPNYNDFSGSWTIGAGLHAKDFESLTARYHNGEDIRAELAQKIYGNMSHIEFYEFPPADGIGYIEISTEKTDSGMTFRTKGGFEITHSWETLGEALITAARQEYDRHEQLDEKYFLDTAKKRINEYTQREFEEDADFSDLSHIPLAYTTYEYTQIGISVYANLTDRKIVTMFGDEIADEQQFKYTDDMLAELNNLTFSDLVTLSEETVQKLMPKEDVKLSGRIEKYGLDIDFTKLDYVEIEVHSDEYIGGIDENGHERMDNYNEVVNSISFYAAHDNSRLLIYDEANNLYEDTVELSEALERISEGLN